MRTPKEEAFALVEAYEKITASHDVAKECALIHVNKVLDTFGNYIGGGFFYTNYKTIEFYKELKIEIQNLKLKT